MALSRQALDGYDAALSKVESAASEYVRRRVEAYLESFPDASVADAREFAKEAVGQAVDAYGDAASAAAADLYDELAEAAGEALPAAAVDTSDVSGFIDRGVRYQAGKLVDGAPTAFAARVSDIARDQVARRANQTMRRNAARDGIRYARVPMGRETCTFCAMLASRGFVYKSASTAGEGNHYHPNCRCKVVPETAGSVEGYDPGEWLGRWQAMSDIDADQRLTAAQKLEAKGRVVGKGLPAPAAIRFLNHMDSLFENVQKVPPLEGYEDVCVHSNGLVFSYTDSDTGSWHDMMPGELADALRSSPDYKGGDIRLISCWAGRNGEDSPAQMLADILGVIVLAPTGKAMVDPSGVMHLADNTIEFFAIDAGKMDENGKWVAFKPRKRGGR